MRFAPGVLRGSAYWAANASLLDQNGAVEFLPMAWGHDGDNADVQTWLSAHPSTSLLLSANEPNLPSQANMTTEQCAAFIEGTVAIAGGRPVVGPHLAAAANTTDFRNGVHSSLAGGLSASAIHVYETTSSGFRYWTTTWPHTGWPASPAAPDNVWVKEFAYGDDGGSEDTVTDFMIDAVDLMERDTRIVRYAWWKDRRKTDGAGFTRPGYAFILSGTTSGALTGLGALYVAMPVHDADLYYGLPGRLQAERYVTMSGFSAPDHLEGDVHLARTADSDGGLDIVDLDSGEWVDFNIDVPTAGAWSLQLRGSGTSTVAVQQNGATLGTATFSGAAYVTTTMPSVTLAAGQQTLRLYATAGSDAAMNWIAFTSPSGDAGDQSDGGSATTDGNDSAGKKSSGCAATDASVFASLVIVLYCARRAHRYSVT